MGKARLLRRVHIDGGLEFHGSFRLDVVFLLRLRWCLIDFIEIFLVDFDFDFFLWAGQELLIDTNANDEAEEHADNYCDDDDGPGLSVFLWCGSDGPNRFRFRRWLFNRVLILRRLIVEDCSVLVVDIEVTLICRSKVAAAWSYIDRFEVDGESRFARGVPLDFEQKHCSTICLVGV